jgi:hypothetical protein
MQNRRAIGVEMLTSKKVYGRFLNAADNEDVVVDEVSSIRYCLFFVALDVWPDGMKSCILCVKHMYKKATTRSSWFRSAEGMGELQEGRKLSGVANEITAIRAMEGRKRRSRDLLKDSKF